MDSIGPAVNQWSVRVARWVAKRDAALKERDRLQEEAFSWDDRLLNADPTVDPDDCDEVIEGAELAHQQLQQANTFFNLLDGRALFYVSKDHPDQYLREQHAVDMALQLQVQAYGGPPALQSPPPVSTTPDTSPPMHPSERTPPPLENATLPAAATATSVPSPVPVPTSLESSAIGKPPHAIVPRDLPKFNGQSSEAETFVVFHSSAR